MVADIPALAEDGLCGGGAHETGGYNHVCIEELSSTCAWAFVVPEIETTCIPHSDRLASIIAITEDEEVYALGTVRDAAALDPIRECGGICKINIGPDVDAGQSRCAT